MDITYCFTEYVIKVNTYKIMNFLVLAFSTYNFAMTPFYFMLFPLFLDLSM